MLVFTVRLSSMGNQYAQQWKGIAFLAEVLPSDCKPVVFIIFFLPLKESFCLLEGIMDEWEPLINRVDQTEITAVSVGLYQYLSSIFMA